MNKINSWYTLPFKKYTEIVHYKQTDDLTNIIYLVSILKDKEIGELENMKKKDFDVLASDLTFIYEQPNLKEANIKWNIKNLENITMENFIDYENLKGDEINMASILSFMSEKTEDEINEMATTEVLNGFFLLQQNLKKYMKSLMYSLLKKSVKMKLKKLVRWRKK
ncbi:hypothetical protein [Sphingobacterium multivorum]|uniref:hypothetical protein n=1 Tax=Sphingobacterium multivorum TaxID=28454 RepID=UPI0028B258B3|nr:hypothetical protein [Sphingobacterium multivorum]